MKKIKYIDLGENSTCSNCNLRYCFCKERQDGTWENKLPIQDKYDFTDELNEPGLWDRIKSRIKGLRI